MGKKNKKSFKVWCFYCEREFEDEKILIQHQKAKHFKCHVCHKKLSTAGGMVVHVLQVHKESITKVPNAKPERESTDLEIFGMDGIPAEVLAARDGGHGLMDDDERFAKVARVELPPSSAFGGLVMRSNLSMAAQPMYAAMPPVYAPPPVGPRPSAWPVSATSQGWNSMHHPGQLPLHAPRPSPPMQPLFPIQTPPPPPPPPVSSVSSLSSLQPLFPIGRSGPPSSGPSLLSSTQTKSSIPAISVSPSSSLPSSSVPGPRPTSSVAVSSRGLDGQYAATDSLVARSPLPLSTAEESSTTVDRMPGALEVVPLVPPMGSHMYASAPSTGGPSIGPPPVISNKPPGPPGPPGMTNEVYLVWDDEVLSMEELRLSFPQYQVLDETLQMNSIDAAFDRRILEGRLAGRMGFST